MVKEISYYQRMIDKDINTIIIHALYDTTDFNPDTLLAWVERTNSYSGELWRVRTKVGENDLGTDQKGLLQIKNIQGQVVSKHSIFSFENIQWEVRNNPAGIYFYQLIAEGEALQSGKIIIEK